MPNVEVLLAKSVSRDYRQQRLAGQKKSRRIKNLFEKLESVKRWFENQNWFEKLTGGNYENLKDLWQDYVYVREELADILDVGYMMGLADFEAELKKYTEEAMYRHAGRTDAASTIRYQMKRLEEIKEDEQDV